MRRRYSDKYIKKVVKERLDENKVSTDDFDGKKVYVCANCGNPINVLTEKRCRFCGEFLVK